jgi:membrane fusion protein, heavy metal efflux system
MKRLTPLVRSSTFAALCLTLVLILPLPATAGPGHDHGDETPTSTAGGPKRQPDGSVFLPKPAQRQMGVRTVVAEEKSLPRALELAGRVLMDPNAGGKVQPTQSGRIEAGPRGLPSVGSAVRKGDVLAYVLPSAGNLERANQMAQLAELRAARGLAEKRLVRLRELADTVPRKEIEALESDVASLDERARALGGGLTSREALTAPVSGTIASAAVVAGQVVEARELLFEIVNPTRLRVGALAYDNTVGSDIAAAYVALKGGERLPLAFVGAGGSLREQALPLVFRSAAIAGGAASSPRLAVGQAVEVVVQTRSQLKGIPVPAAALMKNPSNQTVVWVKKSPERFEPRVVIHQPLDGSQVSVTSGLQAGDRVVTQGATLLNQVR